MKSARQSHCLHCGRKIIERAADQEYIDTFGDDGLTWSDVRENRSMCMIDNYGTAHITDKEWKSAQ